MTPRRTARPRQWSAPRARLTADGLEGRLAPATFTIGNGDIATLIAAVATSNTNNQPDTIVLAPGGTYTFDAGFDATKNALPPVAADNNNPANTLTIDGRGATLVRSSAPSVPQFRFFQVNPAPATLVVKNLTFQDGRVDELGGAIFLNGGSAALSGCTFVGNVATGFGYGGAIASPDPAIISTGSLSIDQCTFRNNRADYRGGAISMGMQTTITASTFEGNVAQLDAGAILFYNPGRTITISGSTVSGNQALTGTGGGIAVSASTLRLIGSTVSGNRAAQAGGAITNFLGEITASTVELRHSTITGNRVFASTARGGGVFSGSGLVSLSHTIVAGNGFEPTVTSGTGPDIFGPVTSVGHNLVGNGAGSTGITEGTKGDKVGTPAASINPVLSPLQFNGGPTKTHVPLAGSPAVDAGDPSVSGQPATDQRGTGFARIQNGRIDIGAAEVQAAVSVQATVNGGAALRSMVTSLTLTFNAVVSFATTAQAAFTLTRIGGGPVTFTPTVTTINGGAQTQVTLAGFTGAESNGFGSLTDGRYTLTALAGQIMAGSLQLDGNGDGSGGDDYVLTDSGAHTGSQLYRLFGDANGDRVVNAADLNLFRAISGATTSDFTFDSDRNGVINAADLNAFRATFGARV